MLAAGDWQHPKRLLTVSAGDDGPHAFNLLGLPRIDVQNFGMRKRAAIDAADQQAGGKEVGSIFSASRHLLRPVDHWDISANTAERLCRVHGRSPVPCKAAAYLTASMILT